MLFVYLRVRYGLDFNSQDGHFPNLAPAIQIHF